MKQSIYLHLLFGVLSTIFSLSSYGKSTANLDDTLLYSEQSALDTMRKIIMSKEFEKELSLQSTLFEKYYEPLIKEYLSNASSYSKNISADPLITERIVRLYHMLPVTTDTEAVNRYIGVLHDAEVYNPFLTDTTMSMLKDMLRTYKNVLRAECYSQSRSIIFSLGEYSWALSILGECDEIESLITDLKKAELHDLVERNGKQPISTGYISQVEKYYFNTRCGWRYKIRIHLTSPKNDTGLTWYPNTITEMLHSPKDTTVIIFSQGTPTIGDTVMIKWYEAQRSQLIRTDNMVWEKSDLIDDKKWKITFAQKRMYFYGYPSGKYRGDVLVNGRLVNSISLILMN